MLCSAGNQRFGALVKRLFRFARSVFTRHARTPAQVCDGASEREIPLNASSSGLPLFSRARLRGAPRFVLDVTFVQLGSLVNSV